LKRAVSVLTSLLAAGVWPAVPLTAYVIFLQPRRLDVAGWPALTRWALTAVAGLAVWSVPLLGTAMLGVYRPVYLGVAGWAAVAGAALAIARRRATGSASAASASPGNRRQPPAVSAWDGTLFFGLAVVALLYLGYPNESIYGGRDEGIYANHAIYLVHHGRLDVPYPWPSEAGEFFAPRWEGFPGLYQTPGTMTVQFSPLLPVWLGQAFATFGHHGLFRLNAVFALLSLAVFYGVCVAFVRAPIAAGATLFLAFNPGELWVARITLSEMLTQLCMWSGLLLLTRALAPPQTTGTNPSPDESATTCPRASRRANADRSPLAWWAGVCFALAAFVRFDSFLLLPVLLLADVAMHVTSASPAQTRVAWKGMYRTALPLFVLALAYFFTVSRPYVIQRPYLRELAVASVAAAVLRLLVTTRAVERVQRVVRSRPALIVIGLVLLGVSAYAYWIRPLPAGRPEMVYQWPGYFLDQSKGNYRSDSLVQFAQYVSPVVVWAAIGGWYLTLWSCVRDRRDLERLAVLVAVAGFSLVYFYDHGNTPDHIWWIRRFVPVVLPGFVLCAALGVRWLIDRLSRPWSIAIAGALLVYLAGFTARADALIVTFSENKGYFAQVNRLARRLPADQPIVTNVHKSLAAPLFLAFDRRLIPIDATSLEGRATWDTWSATQISQNTPAYLLLEVSARSPNSLWRDDVVISRVISEHTVHPLPKKTVGLTLQLELYRATHERPVALGPATGSRPMQ
jgi:hypothetical protein